MRGSRKSSAFIFVSLCFALIGGIFLYMTLSFTKDAVKTQGIIWKYNSEGNVYTAEVKYRTKDNQEVTGDSNMYSSFKPYKLRQQVTIYYHENYPERILIDDFFEKWSAFTICMAISICLLITGIIMLIKEKKSKGYYDIYYGY